MKSEKTSRPSTAAEAGQVRFPDKGNVRLWLAERLRDRRDSEHEQILIRIAIASVILMALAFIAWYGNPSSALISCLPLAIFLWFGAISLLAHLLWRPAANPHRRYIALTLDIASLTLGMILGGEAMVLLYPLFLWVIFGMGFRYGRRYLLVSAAMGLLGFTIVTFFNPYWHEQPLLSVSLLAALVILPAYVSTLLTKLTAALAKAEESNRAKDRFLATMSHELRTPLNAIFGMSDLLEASPLRVEQRDFVITIRSAGRSLLDLIEDVLDVARIETGRVASRQSEFDLHTTFAVALNLLRFEAMKKGLDLRLVIDPSTPYRVLGTERWLKQILVNLLGNAIKFTNAGHITTRVFVEEMALGHVELRIEVEDTGIGIPKDEQQRIFERFAQGDESSSRRYGGTGLGLSIGRQLAEMMGGRLTVDSEVGKGARFCLNLSLETLSDPERRLSGRIAVFGDALKAAAYCQRFLAWGAETTIASQPSEVFDYLAGFGSRRGILVLNDGTSTPASTSQDLRAWFRGSSLNQVLVSAAEDEVPGYLAVLKPDPSDEALYNTMHAALAAPGSMLDQPENVDGRNPRNILIAEDNVTNQKVIQKMLLAGGHTVTVVADGEQMLDMLDQADFDLVLVDLNMPSMSGLEAVKLYRFGVGSGNHPPFVALTADATAETRLACFDVGFADCLTKPLDIHHILSIVDRLTSLPGVEPVPHQDRAEENIVRHPRFAGVQATVDFEHLGRLRALDTDPTFFTTVIGDFIDDAKTLLEELEAAVIRADDSVVRDRAHALHSSAAHVGAIGLSKLCHRWRGVGLEQLTTRGPNEMAELRAEFERLSVQLRKAIADDQVTESDRGKRH